MRHVEVGTVQSGGGSVAHGAPGRREFLLRRAHHAVRLCAALRARLALRCIVVGLREAAHLAVQNTALMLDG